MSGRAQARLLPGGRRLHLQDGPIDLVIEAFGPDDVVMAAYRAAMAAFDGLLDELCTELSVLRAEAVPAGRGGVLLSLPGEGDLGEAQDGCGKDGMIRGPVARRMARAVAPLAKITFITPMAAVAGAVADHILAALVRDAQITRAYVNNGGDIAVHVGPGERLTIGLIDRPDRPSLLGHVAIEHGDGIGGIATSGWRGRSFSLGIADAVTVLARSGAQADAAATIIANAVDLPEHPAVMRVPAESIAPDSDLGSRLVTRDVAPLTESEIARALTAGLACAEGMLARGLILGAALQLQGRVATTTGHLPSPLWRGVGGEGSAGRSPFVPESREFHAQRPSPPAPLHKGEGSARHDRNRVPAPFRNPILEPAHA